MEINLFNYYGLDWMAMALGFYGMWLLGRKHKVSFIFTGLGMIFAFFAALLSQQYGFMVSNIIMVVLSARNYTLWVREENKSK